jgi:hypothetical protein
MTAVVVVVTIETFHYIFLVGELLNLLPLGQSMLTQKKNKDNGQEK